MVYVSKTFIDIAIGESKTFFGGGSWPPRTEGNTYVPRFPN